MSDEAKSSLIKSTVLVVAAFLKNNFLQISELPIVLATVHSALAGAAGPTPAEPQKPAANLRRLVASSAILCADCGGRFKSMKIHLRTHGLTPSAYRTKWGLSPNHPMVAPDYSAVRSELAKSAALGRKPGWRSAKTLAKGAQNTI